MPILADKDFSTSLVQLQVGKTQTEHHIVASEASEVAFQLATHVPPENPRSRESNAETRRERLQLPLRNCVEVDTVDSVDVVGYHIILASDNGISMTAVESVIVSDESVGFDTHLGGVLRLRQMEKGKWKEERYQNNNFPLSICCNHLMPHASKTSSWAVKMRRNIVRG